MLNVQKNKSNKRKNIFVACIYTLPSVDCLLQVSTCSIKDKSEIDVRDKKDTYEMIFSSKVVPKR